MAKIFETAENIVEMVEEIFTNAGLSNYGLGLKVLSLTKARDVVKISRASATTNYLTKNKVDLTLFIYEEAFEKLPETSQRMLIDMVLSNVSYDIEKDKLNVETNPYMQIFQMTKKYGEEFLHTLESSYFIIRQIEEEKKEQKEMEKQNKKNKNI